MNDVRVLIADDDALVRALLSAMIESDVSLTLVGEAASAGEAVELAGLHQPTVALLDVNMPGGGLKAASGIRRVSPATRIIALTSHADRATIFAMVRAGADSYLVKGSNADRILESIHENAMGHGTLSAEIVAEVLRELAGKLEHDEAEEMIRRDQVARVREVLDRSRLRMRFQPIVDLRDGRVAGVEALMTVEGDPPLRPDAWLAVAAAAGLQVDLELAAARAALAERSRLLPGVYLSVNLSPECFVHPRIQALLEPLSGEGLVVEITEHARVEDYRALDDAIGAIRARGTRLAVDDAGSGFASLRHILRLRPDIIKVDLSLTSDIHLDANRRALAAALIAFAAEVGATIVVEGIETQAELACLQSLGAAFGQGYYLGRPGPLDTFDLSAPVPQLT